MVVKTTDNTHDSKNAFLDNIRGKVIRVSMDDTIQGTAQLVSQLTTELNLSVSQKGENFHKVFIDCLRDKEKRLQPSSLKVYRVFPDKLLQYEQKAGIELSFNHWNKQTMQDFYDFLVIDLKLLNDTAVTNIKTLKSFLNWALERGLHKNDRYKAFSVTWEKHVPLVLSSQDVQKLQLLEPQGARLDRVSDVFLFSIYTVQRYSDIQQLHSSQIKEHVWSMYQAKTRKIVSIPLNHQAMSILEKYDFSLPQISLQKFNKYIKELCFLAGITEEVERVSYSGKRKIVKRAAKCDLVSSHTARRTGISLLIEGGAPLPLIQKLTGHSDIETLLKYDGSTINGLIEHLNQMP